MMHQASLLRKLWAEAIHYVAWLKNWLPTKVLGNTTPYERLYGSKPHLAGLPEWGQWVWVHNPSGSKLDACATQAHWVGYDGESTHAHHTYCICKSGRCFTVLWRGGTLWNAWNTCPVPEQCGMVWNGVEWCGTVWNGVEQCGMVWNSVEWCGTVWNGMEWVCLDNTCHPLSPPVNPRNGKILNWS